MGFLIKVHICPIGKNFQEIGLKYKKFKWMAKISPKNVSSSNKIFIDWPSSLKDASQKADLKRDHALPRSCHIMKKGGGKGYI